MHIRRDVHNLIDALLYSAQQSCWKFTQFSFHQKMIFNCCCGYCAVWIFLFASNLFGMFDLGVECLTRSIWTAHTSTHSFLFLHLVGKLVICCIQRNPILIFLLFFFLVNCKYAGHPMNRCRIAMQFIIVCNIYLELMFVSLSISLLLYYFTIHFAMHIKYRFTCAIMQSHVVVTLVWPYVCLFNRMTLDGFWLLGIVAPI